MNKNKGVINLGLVISIVLLVAIVGGTAYYLGKGSSKQQVKVEENNLPNNPEINQNQNLTTDNNQQVNNNSKNKTVTNSCTSDKGNVMTYARALEIAKTSSCNNISKFTGGYSCNKNGGGLVDVGMERPADKPNCGFTCRVSIDTGKVEEGWTCVGALKPITALPAKYLDSQNWPPAVKTSSFAYSCKLSSGSGDVPTVVEEKTINGKKYCITSLIDAGAGSRFGEYTYMTPSTTGSGTKTAGFNLRWSSCGGYDEPESSQCQSTVSTFLNNLDAMVDSLM